MDKEEIKKIILFFIIISLSYMAGKNLNYPEAYKEGYTLGYTIGFNESSNYKYDVVAEVSYPCRYNPNIPDSNFVNFTKEEIQYMKTNNDTCRDQKTFIPSSIQIFEYPKQKERTIMINLTNENLTLSTDRVIYYDFIKYFYSSGKETDDLINDIAFVYKSR